ncbi:MAG: MBL fold metallo-hydrolase [Alphaproteobacteria bacterium]|nr:MBL fold metallo-hydrolase [Alphaproteobacteria bacterium]
MRFRFIGTGTALPDAERGATAFLAQREGRSVLIDGGAGTLRGLGALGLRASELDGGVYSHRHIDHCGELPALLFAMRIERRERDYPIWAGQGFAEHLAGLGRAYPERWLRGSAWAPQVHELPLEGPGEALLPGGLRLRTLPANHGAGALHVRLEAPEGAVVFSGDTGPSPALVELSRGAEVLVCECAFDAPGETPQHLWPEAVRELVAEARPKRVLLTHFYPELDPERALAVVTEAGVPVERARDGQVLTL